MNRRFYVWLSVAALLGLLGPVAVIAVKFWGEWSADSANWGDFGDYLGGTAGVLLNALGFTAVLVTMRIQQNDSLKSDQALARARVEEHLYRLLDTLADVLAGVELRASESGNVIASGRGAFRNFYSKKFAAAYEETSEEMTGADERDVVRASFDLLFRRHGAKFGHYFRTLYHCFLIIEDPVLTPDERQRYADLVSCRLSKFELLLLMYNCLGSIGERKFKALVERYGLFEHLDSDSVFDATHLNFFAGSAFVGPPKSL